MPAAAAVFFFAAILPRHDAAYATMMLDTFLRRHYARYRYALCPVYFRATCWH